MPYILTLIEKKALDTSSRKKHVKDHLYVYICINETIQYLINTTVLKAAVISQIHKGHFIQKENIETERSILKKGSSNRIPNICVVCSLH